MSGLIPAFLRGGTPARVGPAPANGLVPLPSSRPSARSGTGAWRGRPHDEATVATVRRHVEMTTWTYGEIAAATGVGRASICRWTQDGGWRRPAGAPVATDTVGGERASARLRARTLHRRAQDIAQRLLDELERDPQAGPALIASALEMLKAAKRARMPKRRRPPGTAAPASDTPPRPRGRLPSPHLPERRREAGPARARRERAGRSGRP